MKSKKLFFIIFLILSLGCYGQTTLITKFNRIKSTDFQNKKYPGIIELSGICEFNNKLYIGTNRGIIEYQTDSICDLINFETNGNSIESPAFDEADTLLWMMDDNSNKILVYNGRSFQSIDLPEVLPYVSRADVLNGITFSGNKYSFWLRWAHGAYLWNNSKKKWKRYPFEIKERLLNYIMATSSKFYFVFGVTQDYINGKWLSQTYSDTIISFDKNFHHLTNNAGLYETKQVVTIDDIGYIRSTDGNIIKVNETNTSKMETPGKCETLIVSGYQKLIACFVGLGVYEYNGKKWKKMCALPTDANQGEHWESFLYIFKNQVFYGYQQAPIFSDILSSPSLKEFPAHLFKFSSGSWKELKLPN